jgi:ABC-type transport system substrate-binding protein
MRYCNPRVDALERRALVSPSQAERKRLYREIGLAVARDVPLLYLFDANYLYASRTALHGFAPNAFLPTWNAADWSLNPE